MEVVQLTALINELSHPTLVVLIAYILMRLSAIEKKLEKHEEQDDSSQAGKD
jgi:hypothetical protein